MRNRPHRIPRAPRLDWPGGIVPEWAKAPAAAQRRAKGGKGARGKDAGKRERLQKVMAQSGHGSRRNIEILIAQGHITINGQVAKLGDLVGPGDRVKLDGRLIHLRFGGQLPRVLLYHKPEGEICTRDDPEGRPTVFAKLPKVNNARWVSIGRLDFNTSGLLLFTTNGELANLLMHPRYEIEREYAVRLMGELTPEQVQRLTGEGVELDGEKCAFVRLVDKGGEGANHWYHVVLKEGKNREVRRMFEAVGHAVSRLIRIRYGAMALPRNLRRGHWIELGDRDIKALMAMVGMKDPGRAIQERQEVQTRRRSPDRGGAGKKRPSLPAGPARASAPRRSPRSSTQQQQPDPMQTSFGYMDGRGASRGGKGGGGRSAPGGWMGQGSKRRK